jgi:hypothetical protein
MPSDGGDWKRVVSHPADDAHPAWSPDGTRLAFVSARERTGKLNVISGLGQLSLFAHGDDGGILLAEPCHRGIPGDSLAPWESRIARSLQAT